MAEPVDDLEYRVVEQLDKWSVELFDPEVRTIAHHVLAAVVRSDRGVFNRSPRVEALAAGILGFLLARLTGRFSATDDREPGQPG